MLRNYELGSMILRLVLGGIFAIHGLDKFQMGVENVAGWFASIGLPSFLAYVVTFIEILGGLALILGLGTRLVSAVLGIIMLGAIVTVKLSAGFLGNGQMAGYELDLALLAMSVYLVINGSQRFSIDGLLRRNRSVAQEQGI